MDFAKFITVFIVAYLFWFICRWFVLPHLKIFPYIPPMWLWTTLYGIFVYVMNWIFLWIILYLIICYVSWIFIRESIPDFPIPLQSILLDMAPWKPLTNAGVLQFIDKLVRIVFSRDAIRTRARKAATATADFLKSSFVYLQREIGYRKNGGVKPDANRIIKTDPQYKDVPQEPPKRKVTVRRSTKPSPFENDEMKQINDEYLQCVEQRSVPVYSGQGLETAQAIAKNKTVSIMCKLNMMKTYSNLMYNRA